MKQLYIESTRNTNEISMLHFELDPEGEFNSTVFNKARLDWNFIAYHNKTPVGMFTIQTYNYHGFYGTLGMIAVTPRNRGKGYSKDMLKRFENQLFKEGIKEWRESTGETNKPMIMAFLSVGFKQTREHVGYIYKPEIAFKKFL